MKNDFNNNAEAERYDPVSLLFKERVIIVAGQVNTQMAYNIIAQLQKLEFVDNKLPIKMIINSPGGSVIDGMAIFDAMRAVSCPIETVGNGMQASMGSILLAAGDTRGMTKNSMLLVHQIMGGAEGGTQHSDFEISAAFMAQLHEKLKSVYVEFTGLNHKFWDIVGERDSWMTAEQALKIGYINGIFEDKKPGGKYAAEAVRGDKKEGLQAILDKATKDYIAKMSADEIAKVINSGNAAGGVYAGLRGELIVKLAEFPEFWTDAKKLEVAAAAKAADIANDNGTTKSPTAKKKTGNGPSAS
jgi:ATP-dependent Clp protease protease subunit